MDSLNYKYIHASKQKRIIALQDNRQMPTKQIQKMDERTWLMKYLKRCMIWRVSAKASL